jgi:hypothetical protein
MTDPQQIGALVERGHLYRKRGDNGGAMIAFKTATAVNPVQVDIKLELARDLRALNHFDDAEANHNDGSAHSVSGFSNWLGAAHACGRSCREELGSFCKI